MFQRCLTAVICAVLLLSIAACIRPYKTTISQGSLLRVQDIEQLKIGMTREQVVFLIGEPIVRQPFEKSRWDYVFMSRRGYLEPVRRNLTLLFDGDKLAKIENNYYGKHLAGEKADLPENLQEISSDDVKPQ